MNTLTTVKTFADVRQVLRGYAAAHPPEADWTATTVAFERAAAQLRKKKSASFSPEACAEAGARDGAVVHPQAEQAARDQKFERYDLRRERLDDALLDFSPESKSARTSTWPWRSANCGPRRGWRRSKSTSRHRGPVVSQRIYAG